MRKWGLVVGMLVFAVSPSRANDIYLAASGSGNGSSCSAARAYSFFNVQGNWGDGSSQIGPGTTVHLCGAITGEAGAQLLVARGSGTTAHPITIHFETGASIRAPYFKSTGAINISGASYIVVDGGTNGLIEATLNGSPGATCPGGECKYQEETKAIYADPCNGCEIANLTISSMYVHTQCDASSGCDTRLRDFNSATAIYFGGSNIELHNLIIHDTGAVFYMHASSGSTAIYIYDNDVYNFDHGFFGGPCGRTCTLGTLSIHDNHLHDQAAWDTGTADAYHHDGIHFWDGNVGTTSELDIYNNLFDGVEGRCCITAWVYLQGAAAVNNIFNNVFVQTIDVPNGAINMSASTTGLVFNLYNNTLLSTQSASGTGTSGPGITYTYSGGESSTVNIVNNVFSGYNTYIALPSPDVRSFHASNNVYANDSMGGNEYWQLHSFKATSLAAWQAGCHCDAGAIADLKTSLGVSSSGVPEVSFIGKGHGANLMYISEGALLALTHDTSAGDTRTPSPRPVGTSAWDAGAYNAGSAAPPAAPSGMRATVE
ncbi:MAG TPA: hypothetical protein VEJ67_11785 [Candidatus Cybelea sp.]|nr:hypothetical protein [Candidatus Cybelea sp.]